MNIEALRAKIASHQKLAVGVAVVGALACIGAAIMNPAIFYRGYLLGFMFFMNLTLGCLGLATAWRAERNRGDCWRDLAEEGVSSAAPCRP